MHPSLELVYKKIEDLIPPKAYVSVAVVFQHGERTTVAEDIIELLRHIRLNRKPLGLIIHTNEPPPHPNKVEAFDDLSETELVQFKERAERFIRMLPELDDDFDEFDSEEEELEALDEMWREQHA